MHALAILLVVAGERGFELCFVAFIDAAWKLSRDPPHENHRAGELEKSREVERMPLVAGHDPTIVEEPREESLDLPLPVTTSPNATILRVLSPTAADVRCNHLGASVLEFTVELVAVASSVADQKERPLPNDELHLIERVAHEPGFVRRSTVDPNSDRGEQCGPQWP